MKLKILRLFQEGTREAYERGAKLLTAFLQRAHFDDTISIITKVDPYDLMDTFTYAATKKWIRYLGIKVFTEVRDRIFCSRYRLFAPGDYSHRNGSVFQWLY